MTTQNKLREKILNAEYRNTDKQLDKQLDNLLDGSPYKLRIGHHSHKLSTTIKNASNYDKSRSNGITVVVLTSPSLPKPIYQYAICSVSDNYSRLIGRVQAKEALIRSISNKDTLSLTTTNETQLEEISRYITEVVKTFIPRPKKTSPLTPIHPLTFVDENSLVADIKMQIFEMVGAKIKDIQVKFEYIRKYQNKTYSGFNGTNAFIKDKAQEYPQDEISTLSQGGFTVAYFSAPIKDDADGNHVLIASITHCLPTDTFDKGLGRKTSLSHIHNTLFKKRPKKKTLVQIMKFIPSEDIALNENVALHMLSSVFQQSLNTYVEAKH